MNPLVRRRRRRLPALALVIILLVGLAAWAAVPRAAGPWSGDSGLARAADPSGPVHRLAIARVDGDGAIHLAQLGSTPDDSFEIGSVTKGFTGLLLARAVRRHQIRLEDPLGRWLPLEGSPVAAATLLELATHSSGLPGEGVSTNLAGTCWVTGGSCMTATRATVLDDLRAAPLEDRGSVSYSNLGAAAVGMALERATGHGYPELVQELTHEHGMRHTAVQQTGHPPLVAPGRRTWGLRTRPWPMEGYQSAGGLVSTSSDLARWLATAPDDPDLAEAIRPRVAWPEAPDVAGITEVQLGLFWATGTLDGHRVAFHTGETSGYRAIVVLDVDSRRSVLVLSDVNRPLGQMAARVLRAELAGPG